MMPSLLSIITPAYNEHGNVGELYLRLERVLDGLAWEWLVVDDHSSDETFQEISELAWLDSRVRGIRLANNSGSHVAIACGMAHASGDAAVVMSADLQDPPELIPSLLDRWRAGFQVVWAARGSPAADSASNRAAGKLFYFLLRKVAGLARMPPEGADFFLVNREALAALRQFGERHANLFALLAWMGFRQTSVNYERQARARGQSGWTLASRLKLAVDSITAFTYAPIRAMSWAGVITALAGFLYAAFILVNFVAGSPPQGWSSLMVVLLVIGGMQMLMMGVLGEYLWRALEESRRRPRYLVEQTTARSSRAAPGGRR